MRPTGSPAPSCRFLPAAGCAGPMASSTGIARRAYAIRAARRAPTSPRPPRARSVGPLDAQADERRADRTADALLDRAPRGRAMAVPRRSSKPTRPRSAAAGCDCAEADARREDDRPSAMSGRDIIGRASSATGPSGPKVAPFRIASRPIGESAQAEVVREVLAARAAGRRAGRRRSPRDVPRRC